MIRLAQPAAETRHLAVEQSFGVLSPDSGRHAGLAVDGGPTVGVIVETHCHSRDSFAPHAFGDAHEVLLELRPAVGIPYRRSL